MTDTLALSQDERTEADTDQPVNLFAMLHRLFRGRYFIAVPVVAICAIGGGVMGYLAGGPVYTSTGVVRVRPSLPKILYSTELENTPGGARFENYVSTQARLFTTERVLRRAMEDPDLPPQATEDGVNGLRSLLDVSTERNAPELIFVNATTPEPAIAQAIVSATVGAYMELYADENSLRKPETINTLEDLRREKQAEIRTKKNQIRTLAEEWGTEDLDPLHKADLERVTELEELLRQQESRLLELRSARDRQLVIEEGVDDLDAREIDEVIELFPNSQRIASLAAQRAEYESRLRELKASGTMEQNIRYRSAQQSLAQVEQQIRDHAAQLVSDRTGSQSLLADIELTETQIARLEEAIAELRTKAARISNAKSQIEQRRDEIEDLEADLARIENRLNEIMVESKVEDFSDVGGRITVISEGNRPNEPSDDTRRKLAAFGFVGAGGASFMLFAGLGWIDRRVRYSDDIARTPVMPPLLAVIPTWKPSRAEPLLPSAIANIVHRLRSLLEVNRTTDSRRPLVITSGLPGEGKTSLVLSLGISYAHAGNRVLLVDLDPIGRSLTGQLDERPSVRLSSVILDENPELSARPTRIPSVDLLGASAEDESLASRLSADKLASFFDRLGARYDVVLVDTSPLVGGVESTLACAAAGGVVMVVGRGTSQRMVEQCNEQLRSLGARVLGLVFNGATRADFSQSPSSQTYSARGSHRLPRNGQAKPEATRWCPSLERASLAEAVASTLVEVNGDPEAPAGEPSTDDLD